jgi:hypothetical protein
MNVLTILAMTLTMTLRLLLLNFVLRLMREAAYFIGNLLEVEAA